MTDFKSYKQQVYQIIGAAMNVHRTLRWGLLEQVYQEALFLELKDMGIESVREQLIPIYYREHLLEKQYRMDMVVDDIIVELKSVTCLTASHRAQICNYLRLTKKPIGLLINFGEESLVGERWGYDEESNRCFLVDRNMEIIPKVDYHELLYRLSLEEEEEEKENN